MAGLLLVNLASDVKEEIDAIANMDRRRAQVLFSGWSEVAPNRPIDINFMLEEPIDRTMDLIVLSKAAGDSVDFSWLKIFNFRRQAHRSRKPRSGISQRGCECTIDREI